MTRQVTKKIRELTFRDLGRRVIVKGESFNRSGLPVSAATYKGRLREVRPLWDSGVIDTAWLSLSTSADYTTGIGDTVDVVVDPDDEITVTCPDFTLVGTIT